MNYGGKIVYYGAPLPAFMVEFGLTSGVGKAAQASTLKVIGEAVEKSAVKAVAAKTTGRVARVAAQSAAMVPMLASKYGERRAGAWNVTDKGEVIFAGADESPAKSALMAYAHVSAEVASELSGATLNKYLINPVTKRLATPLISGINKLPEKLKLALYNNYKRLKGNARVSRVFTAGGWNGMLAELGEERIADILRETTNLTLEEGYTFDEVLDGITPSKDDLLLEAGLISIVGGVKTSGSVVMNFLTSDGLSFEQAQEVLDNLTVQEQENIIDYTLVVETYDPNSLVMLEDIDLQIEQELIATEELDINSQTQEEIKNYVDNMDARVDELLPTDTVPLEEIASSSIVEELAPVKEGMRVKAGDRGNIGTVLSVDGDTVLVRFVNI